MFAKIMSKTSSMFFVLAVIRAILDIIRWNVYRGNAHPVSYVGTVILFACGILALYRQRAALIMGGLFYLGLIGYFVYAFGKSFPFGSSFGGWFPVEIGHVALIAFINIALCDNGTLLKRLPLTRRDCFLHFMSGFLPVCVLPLVWFLLMIGTAFIPSADKSIFLMWLFGLIPVFSLVAVFFYPIKKRFKWMIAGVVTGILFFVAIVTIFCKLFPF